MLHFPQSQDQVLGSGSGRLWRDERTRESQREGSLSGVKWEGRRRCESWWLDPVAAGGDDKEWHAVCRGHQGEWEGVGEMPVAFGEVGEAVG